MQINNLLQTMVNVGDAVGGRKKIENPENPGNFRHTKDFGKYYGSRVASGLIVVVLGFQLLYGIIDFLSSTNNGGEKKQRGNNRR